MSTSQTQLPLATGRTNIAPVLPQELASAPEASGKLGLLLCLMRRDGGASIYDMAEATGWHVHSVRGALAGPIKKRLKMVVTSQKCGRERVYRVAPAAPPSGA